MPCAFGEVDDCGVRPALPEPASAAPDSASATCADSAMTATRRTNGHSRRVERRSRIELPDAVRGAFEVYVNGVHQAPGRDYEQHGRTLFFTRELKQEGRLGFWRWTSIFLGVAGTYRQNDSVDIVYEANGRKIVAAKLPLLEARLEGHG